MLVVFKSFNDLFAILCSVIRKVLQRRKKLSHDDHNIGGICASCLEKQSKIPVPLHHWRVVETTPFKDLVNEPVVLKANERFNSRLFNLRLKHRNRVFISSPRRCVDCRFLQRLLRFLGHQEDCCCRSPPMINQIQEIQAKKPTDF